MNGAHRAVETLIKQGVDVTFGFPGGTVIPLFDAFLDYKGKIKNILVRHEQGAAHAAEGYARASGKAGICIATSGPGATNLVTGIADAYMDSVPIIAFGGQVPTSLIGNDAFQEADMMGITIPITKHGFIVKDVRELADTIRKAFLIAKTGRPGPVLVDICKDVTAAITDYEFKPAAEPKEIPIGASEEEINEVAKVINNSHKPMILSGGGVIIADAAEELFELATKANIPVANTLMGLGSFPGDNDLFTGLVGMHGVKASNFAITETDLLIAIGARFSDRVISNVKKFAPHAKIVHIDIDPAEVGKNVFTHYSLIGNIKKILKVLNTKVEKKGASDWNTKVDEWKETFPLTYADDSVLRPQYIMERIDAITGGDVLITTEVGQNQMWAAQFFKYTHPRQFISSGGLGTMGYGLGACIGTQFAKPDKKVINIAGDGSFRMNLTEIATAVEYKLPIIIAILNNRVLGMVRQWQQYFYGSRYAATNIDRGTDFVALAKAFGAIGINVTKREEVDDAIKEALKSTDRPVVINFEIDRDEKVLPMVAPGAAVNELIDS